MLLFAEGLLCLYTRRVSFVVVVVVLGRVHYRGSKTLTLKTFQRPIVHALSRQKLKLIQPKSQFDVCPGILPFVAYIIIIIMC